MYLPMVAMLSVPSTMQTTILTGPRYRDVRIREGYATVMPTVGDVNMLVIPINFSDANCQLILEGCAQTKLNIETAFFGDPEDMR